MTCVGGLSSKLLSPDSSPSPLAAVKTFPGRHLWVLKSRYSPSFFVSRIKTTYLNYYSMFLYSFFKKYCLKCLLVGMWKEESTRVSYIFFSSSFIRNIFLLLTWNLSAGPVLASSTGSGAGGKTDQRQRSGERKLSFGAIFFLSLFAAALLLLQYY